MAGGRTLALAKGARRLRALADDVHRRLIDQCVACATGDWDIDHCRNVDIEVAGVAWSRSKVTWQKARLLTLKKDQRRNRHKRDGRLGASALGPAAQNICGASIGGKDSLDGVIKGEGSAIVVAGRVGVVWALHLEEAPRRRIQRLAVDGGFGPG